MNPIHPITLAASLATFASLTTPAPAAQMIMMESSNSVSQAADKLVQAVQKAGATVFAVVDHQANAKKAGLEMQPATLVIFGNPKLGTPIMNADINAGLDLPIRVLIVERDGKTVLQALGSSELKQRYGVEKANEALSKMDKALTKLLTAAAS